jgi:hypothetical protein
VLPSFRINRSAFFSISQSQTFVNQQKTATCNAAGDCLNWLTGYIVEIFIPYNGEYDADGEKDQTNHHYAMVFGSVRLLFGKLAVAILRVSFMLLPKRRQKNLYNAAQRKADAQKSTLATDKHHTGKHKQKDSRNEKSVGQNLNIDTDAIGEESLYPKHANRD